MFSVNLSKKRARDEKFGKNGGYKPDFRVLLQFFYQIFSGIVRKSKKSSEKLKKSSKIRYIWPLYGLEMRKFKFLGQFSKIGFICTKF